MRNVIPFIRSLIFLMLMIVVTVVWAPISMLFAFLPYNQRYYITARWNVFIIWAAKVVCGIRYQFKGFDNFPDGPAILLAKHQSAWETIFLLMATPRPLVFVFKKEITYIPFFGWAIALLRMIPIDRSKGKDAFAQVVVHGKKRLADGQWIIMFPEGTRIAVGKKGSYKGGGARLAVETQTQVVPIALNSGECWPKNSFIKRPGIVTVSVGKPIQPGSDNPVELMQKVEAWIEAEMRVISPNAYHADGSQK
ncbi:lysophospholipid acyltransferase family protein [Undibacterium sp. RuRC25W]|uniref:lysophospholipid acyltransferase family protein n=1 Tax=Undibacterium sp. RuRC25W TaxID=3413047 RepID=UPI003BF0BACB